MRELALDLDVPIADIQVRVLESEDGPLVQALFDSLHNVDQLFGESGPADAVSTYVALPKGKTYEDKLLLGLGKSARLVGVVDCVAAYPDPRTWTIGLLVIDERHRGHGIGTALIRLIERLATARAANTVRCPVRSTNSEGAAFLTRVGYSPTQRGATEPVVFERHIGGRNRVTEVEEHSG